MFVNGPVFDGVSYRPGLTVGVRSGRIVSVAEDRSAGDRTAANRTAADRSAGDTIAATEVVDLHGGLLLPGFVDAHVHPVQGGLERGRCDLAPAHGLPAYQQTIQQYVVQHPDVPWIVGGGWH